MKKIIQNLTYLFLFLLPWQTIWIYSESLLNGVKWQYGTLGFYATELLAWSIIILFLSQYIRVIKKNSFVVSETFGSDRLFIICYLVFIIYLFSSSFWSPVPDVARQHALRITLAFLLFIFCFTSSFTSARAKMWFIYGGILPSVLGIWQFLSQSTFSSAVLGLAIHPAEAMGSAIVAFGDERWLRAYGSFSHPNVFGGYLVFVIFFIFHYWLEQKKINRKNNEQYVVSVAAILAVTALFMTFSRSAWLAYGLLFIGTGWWYMKKHLSLRFHLMLVVPIIILSLLFFPIVAGRIGLGSYQEYLSLSERMSLIVGAKDLIITHVWFGTGAGNYTAAMYQHDPTKPGWLYQPVHMVPLLVFAEIGVVGLFLLMLCFASFIWCFKELLFVRRAIIMIGIVTLLPLFMFDHYLYSSYFGLMLLVFLTVALVQKS